MNAARENFERLTVVLNELTQQAWNDVQLIEAEARELVEERWRLFDRVSADIRKARTQAVADMIEIEGINRTVPVIRVYD